MVVKTNDDERFIKNNLFFGDVDSRFTTLDSNPVKGDPKFNLDGKYKFKYQLQANSPAINNGLGYNRPSHSWCWKRNIC